MAKTQKRLEENLEKLTTVKPEKAKSTTKPKKKPASKPRTKKKTEITIKESKDSKLFPHTNFTYRLDDKKEDKTCWFECQFHAEKYIHRYHLQSKEYTLWHYHKQ